jgi:hypothetical protein
MSPIQDRLRQEEENKQKIEKQRHTKLSSTQGNTRERRRGKREEW